MRHCAHARLLAFDDPLWRRPLYSGQESCDGPVASAANAISRRLAFIDSVSRLRRGSATIAARPRQSWALLHQHPRRTPPGTARPSRSEEHTSELQSLTNLVCRLLLEK